MAKAMLDRQQRAALRRDIALCAGEFDIALGFRNRDRAYVRGCAGCWRRWTPSAGASRPRHRSTSRCRSAAHWAAGRDTRELSRAFGEFDVEDSDPDAYGALCAIGGA